MVRMTRTIKKIILSCFLFQNIRELVNTVRTEIGALIDADRKEHIISSYNKSKNINLSALKKKKKAKTKRTSKQ